jgi:hypothetical protein
MTSRRISIGITAALMAFAGATIGSPATGAVRAQAPTACTIVFDVVAAPGLTTSPSSGTITTNGETGTLNCNGPVNGKQPTGQGTSGIVGHYGTKGGDTCQSGGAGDGVESFTVPTSSGKEHVTNTITFTYGGIQGGLFTGQFQGDRMSGTFTARPGGVATCTTTPMTKFHVDGKGTLR